jgi:uncharacterized membrane protein
MSNYWYLYQNQQQSGPYSWEQLHHYASTGAINRMDLVWSEGMAEWARADQIPRLFPPAAPNPPSAAPPPLGQPAAQAYSSSYNASHLAGQKSSTGMEPNVAALLSYILGWLTGLIFFLIEKDNKFVKFHAMQSIVFFGGLTLLQILLGIFTSVIWSVLWRGVGTWAAWSTVTGLLGILSTLIWLATVILAIVAMVKAYKGEIFKLPVAGGIAEKQLY